MNRAGASTASTSDAQRTSGARTATQRPGAARFAARRMTQRRTAAPELRHESPRAAVSSIEGLAGGRRVQARWSPRRHRTKNAQSGRRSTMRSDSGMPPEGRRGSTAVGRGRAANGSTNAVPRVPVDGTMQLEIVAKGSEPTTPQECALGRSTAVVRSRNDAGRRSRVLTGHGRRAPAGAGRTGRRARTPAARDTSSGGVRARANSAHPGADAADRRRARVTVNVPSARPAHSTAARAACADRDRTPDARRLTMKQLSRPIPNWPRRSVRGRSRMSRLELRPTVASSSPTSAAVSPTPSSSTANTAPASSAGSTRMVPTWPGSWSRRAAIASHPFCRSSRMKTCGPV